MPIVIVANKTDKEREMDQIETETTVLMDWENGYVECSAMLDKVQNKYKLNYFLREIIVANDISYIFFINSIQNINEIFKELLQQVRSEVGSFSGLPKEGLLSLTSNLNMKRRQSLPVVPAFNKTGPDSLNINRRRGSRRGSVAAVLGKESCKVS